MQLSSYGEYGGHESRTTSLRNFRAACNKRESIRPRGYIERAIWEKFVFPLVASPEYTF